MNSWKQRRFKQTLDELYGAYLKEFHSSPSEFFRRRRDPILFAHRYHTFYDQEATAFLAATFAYGNVTSLCRFIEELLSLLQPSPYEFLREGPRAVNSLKKYRPYYRLQKTEEILSVLKMLASVYSRHDSLYALYRASYYEYDTTKLAIKDFINTLRGLSDRPLKFLLPSPSDGSPCKRLNLFFRWMVRRDGLDLGLWKEISPAKLIMPVDTHIGRVAYRLGWIHTPSLTWQKAEAITDVLRQFDPEDPTRYDFSLCHESISRSQWLTRLLYGSGESRN